MRKGLINTNLINFYIKEKGITKKAFCESCDISTNTLNNVLKNDKDIFIGTLLKIVRVMNIKLCEIFA